jgi:hypothetical protein
MTLHEMTATLEALFDEGDVAIARAEKLLPQVPEDDIIVDELWGLFMGAGDEYTAARTNPREELDKIVAAATKFGPGHANHLLCDIKGLRREHRSKDAHHQVK